MRPLTDVLKTGGWSGSKAFVVGGGQSLKGFDLKHLTNHLAIATNEMPAPQSVVTYSRPDSRGR